MGAELFHADTRGRTDEWTDRQTDMSKLVVDFHNFANKHKKGIQYSGHFLSNIRASYSVWIVNANSVTSCVSTNMWMYSAVKLYVINLRKYILSSVARVKVVPFALYLLFETSNQQIIWLEKVTFKLPSREPSDFITTSFRWIYPELY